MTRKQHDAPQDGPTITQADRDRVVEMDDALGCLTETERPILLTAFAAHREAAERATIEKVATWADAGGFAQVADLLWLSLQPGEWK